MTTTYQLLVAQGMVGGGEPVDYCTISNFYTPQKNSLSQQITWQGLISGKNYRVIAIVVILFFVSHSYS